MALFAKILKNEVNEGFHYVQLHITTSVKQYLKECIREKWPLKSEPEISQLLQDMISQRKRVDDSLWKRLLQRLYPAGNNSVLEKLQDIYLGRKLLLE